MIASAGLANMPIVRLRCLGMNVFSLRLLENPSASQYDLP